MAESASSEDEGPAERKRGVKTAVDTQKAKLERLMQNPEKLAHIPDGPKDKPPPPPAEYVRFYMGSSAGAGSGEFHIYRNLRRKEQNRMKFIDDQAKKDKLQSEFDVKFQESRHTEETKTSKKRAKRLKQKAKNSKKGSAATESKTVEESGSSDEAEDGAASRHGTAMDGGALRNPIDSSTASTTAPQLPASIATS